MIGMTARDNHHQPPPRERRITLHDVARHANVSHQTVSRVINNYPHVKAATRSRVLQAIDELGYTPNRSARSIREGRSGTLAFIAFYSQSYISLHQSLLSSAQVANEQGYNLQLAVLPQTGWDDIRPVLDQLLGWQVDGILFAVTTSAIDYSRIRDYCAGVPIVQRDVRLGLDVPAVINDQYHGAKLTVEHLIGLGHHKFALINGPPGWYATRVRQQAWHDTLTAAGIENWASAAGDWTSDAGYHATCELIASGVDFTALIACNDEAAFGALRALADHHLRVPEDVSVVGYDGVPNARYFTPPLTTIDAGYISFGQIAVQHLTATTHPPSRRSPNRRIHRASPAPPDAS